MSNYKAIICDDSVFIIKKPDGKINSDLTYLQCKQEKDYDVNTKIFFKWKEIKI